MTPTSEATQGRRAARAPRGKAKPPSTGRRRRPALIGLAVLLVVGGAAIAGLLALRIDSRTEVLVAARQIPVGAQITEGDLATARVASEGLDLVPASQARAVIGSFASQEVPAGRLIDEGMVSGSGFLTDGSAAVGVPLVPGQVPASGVAPGDVVQVIALGQTGDAAVLVGEATVSSVGGQSSESSGGGLVGGGGGSSSASGTSGTATLIVDQADGPKVALAAADKGVALILLSRGGTVGSN